MFVRKKHPRSFSFQLKKDPFDTNSTSNHCNQQISSVDDAVVELHILHWKDSETI